jgi:hypothetical protein
MAVVGTFTCGVIFISGMVAYILKQQKLKHTEKMAMINKGIYVEARKQESGVPSMAIIILVGIGLAVLAANQDPFLGFALLFIGVGLIVRDRLLRHKKRVTGRLQTGALENEKPSSQAPEDEPWA